VVRIVSLSDNREMTADRYPHVCLSVCPVPNGLAF
jgi:hypothetical protein